MFKARILNVLPALIVATVTAASAQNFTSAAEVKPILSATKPNWVAVRLYEGRDLLYFTNLLSWRCGLDKIEYAVNGGAFEEFTPEPCYDDAAQPNALNAESLEAILVPFDPNSVENVAVKILFDDGSMDEASYTRQAIEIQ